MRRLFVTMIAAAFVPAAHGMRTDHMDPVPFEDRRGEFAQAMDHVYALQKVLVDTGADARASRASFRCPQLKGMESRYIEIAQKVETIKQGYSVQILSASKDELARFWEETKSGLRDVVSEVERLGSKFPEPPQDYAEAKGRLTCSQLTGNLYLTLNSFVSWVSVIMDYAEKHHPSDQKAGKITFSGSTEKIEDPEAAR